MAQYRSARGTGSNQLVERLTGGAAVSRAVDQLQMIATTQIRALTRPPYVADPAEPNDVGRFRTAPTIRYRGVWDKTAIELPGAFDSALLDVRNGEETRVFDGVPVKLYIADDRRAVIPIPRLELDSCDALVIHPSELLICLSTLFELIWRLARPLRLRSEADDQDAGLSARQHDLLQMLGAGMTDESIARSLGWSMRTVQRHVRQILDVLSCDTRLQAGVAAAKRGWL